MGIEPPPVAPRSARCAPATTGRMGAGRLPGRMRPGRRQTTASPMGGVLPVRRTPWREGDLSGPAAADPRWSPSAWRCVTFSPPLPAGVESDRGRPPADTGWWSVMLHCSDINGIPGLFPSTFTGTSPTTQVGHTHNKRTENTK